MTEGSFFFGGGTIYIYIMHTFILNSGAMLLSVVLVLALVLLVVVVDGCHEDETGPRNLFFEGSDQRSSVETSQKLYTFLV